jgi:anti-sigma factor RsiW
MYGAITARLGLWNMRLLVCRDVTELTTDYIEHELPPVRRMAMTFHLAICSFCRRHIRQVRETVRLLRGMPHPPPEQALEEQVMAKLGPTAPSGVAPPAD